MHRSRLPHPALLLGLAILGFAFGASTVTRPAMAATPCYQQVIDDWFDNGRVDKIYSLPCYPKAIKNLPDDIKIYGNAEDEIRRAWAYAKVGKPDPGPKTDTTQTDGNPTDTTQTGTSPTDTTRTGTNPTDTNPTDTTPTDTTPGSSDTSGPSSVPVPLIVLGGLAVLLLAAGSASYVRRRMNGGEDGTDDGASPPDAG